jgi:hypothetical protein
MRADAQADKTGDAITVTPIDQDFSGNLSIRKDFSRAIANYCVFRALDIKDDKRKEQYEKRFIDLVLAAPYNWTDAILAGYANDAVREIRSMRPDARVDENGDAITVEPIDSAFEDNLSIRNDFQQGVIDYCVCRAVELGISKDNLSDTYYKRFLTQISAAAYNWNDAEAKEDIYQAVLAFTSLRPETMLNERGSIEKVYPKTNDNDAYSLDKMYFNEITGLVLERLANRLPGSTAAGTTQRRTK